MQALIIRDRRTLAAAQMCQDMDTITVDTAALKYRNLLPCALKYALWAVRPGGRITIVDGGHIDPASPAFAVSFNLVRQWTFKFIGNDCRVISCADGRIELERVTAVLGAGWSAGVVFSGQDGEIPTLLRCLDGLHKQPELVGGAGEIVVCGPDRDLDFLNAFPRVRYLVFETSPGPRLLIGLKKNFLMQALRNPRMVILHARIILDEGALSRTPREFDILSPNVRVALRHQSGPYLSLAQTDAVWTGLMSRRPTRMFLDLVSNNPLDLMERGGVYADGGAFYVTRGVFEACPLHPAIAWQEGEDMEWCGRAFSLGFLVDMTTQSTALSQTSKLRDWSGLGALGPPSRRIISVARTARAGAVHLIQRLAGRR